MSNRVDVLFSIREGERLEPSFDYCCDIACGTFEIPPPGRMGECTDAHGGPAELYRLSVATRRQDGTFTWERLCPGTARFVGEILFNYARGQWHYFKIVK